MRTLNVQNLLLVQVVLPVMSLNLPLPLRAITSKCVVQTALEPVGLK